METMHITQILCHLIPLLTVPALSQSLASVRPRPWLIHKCWGCSSQCRRLQDLALSLVPVPVTSFMPTWLELFLASVLCAWIGSIFFFFCSICRQSWIQRGITSEYLGQVLLQTLLMFSKRSVLCHRYIPILLLGCPNVYSKTSCWLFESCQPGLCRWMAELSSHTAILYPLTVEVEA